MASARGRWPTLKFNLLMPMRATKYYDRWIEDGHLVDVARLAESSGFDGVAATEHPMPDDGWLAQGGHRAFDPIVALSFMAAATTRVQLLTFVLVAGYRNPYATAKALASLDKSPAAGSSPAWRWDICGRNSRCWARTGTTAAAFRCGPRRHAGCLVGAERQHHRALRRHGAHAASSTGSPGWATGVDRR